MSGRPKASTIGQYDGDGRCTSVRVALLDDVLGRGDAHEPAVRRPRRTCGARTRRACVTVGTSSKLCAGVGDWDHPLEAAGVPRVGPEVGNVLAPWPCAGCRQMLKKKMQHADGDGERADGADHVPEVEAVAVLVGVGAAGHALQAEDVHRPEREVEADEHQPEVPPCRASR